MSDGSARVTTSASTDSASGQRPPRRRRRWVLIAVTVLVVLVVAAVVVDRIQPDGISFAHPLGVAHPASTGVSDNGATTATKTVTRRSLSAQTTVSGTLGYADSYTVAGRAPGTITALPAVGQVVRQGQVLYRVNNEPVILLYGSTPAYRNLAEGAIASDVTGRDVQE
ncbi:MAG: hypothetical protein ACRDRL_23500, partial [Sciscionella sp.]